MKKTKVQILGITEFPYREFDDKGNETYSEYSGGYWSKCEYDDKGDVTYYENSVGSWHKFKYDDNSNETYWEKSDGEKEYIIIN